MLVPRRHLRADKVPPVLRFDPRADLRALGHGPDGAFVAIALAVAVILSSLWLPSFGWASDAAATATRIEVAEGKGPRRLDADPAARCAGRPWGAQNVHGLATIQRASGRTAPVGLRVVL